MPRISTNHIGPSDRRVTRVAPDAAATTRSPVSGLPSPRFDRASRLQHHASPAIISTPLGAASVVVKNTIGVSAATVATGATGLPLQVRMHPTAIARNSRHSPAATVRIA